MKEGKTQIKKVVIEIAGKELLLTPSQAKELRDILCELYAKPAQKTVEHVYHDRYPWQRWTLGYPYTYNSVSGNDLNTGAILMNDCSSASSDTLYLKAVA